MKKLSNIITCLFAGSIIILFSSCKGCKQKDENHTTDVVVFASGVVIPDYQSKPLKTYEVSDKSAVDETTAINNMKQLITLMGEQNSFDLTNKVKDGDRLFFMNKLDPSASSIVNLKTGDITANAGTKNYMNLISTPGLIKKDEAVSIAKRYLTQLKYADFNDASLVQGHVGGVNMGTHDSLNQSQVFEKFTTVRFDRNLDSLPLLGHSRIVVQLAEQGKLHGMIKQWPAYNGSAVNREAEVVPDDAKKSIATHLMQENKNAKNITVEQVNLVYYESRGKIEPALHIICKVQLAKSKTDTTRMTFPYDIVEPILKDPKMLYTYMAESHKDQPKLKDEADMKQPAIRGSDEKK